MTAKEAVEVIKANWPPENRKMIVEALEVAIEYLNKTSNCPHLDNIGGCCKTSGHKECTCVVKGKP